MVEPHRRWVPVALLLVFVACSALGGAAPGCTGVVAHQFDFWLGDWKVDNRNRSPKAPHDPTWHATGEATDRVERVAGGCGIVEDWRGDLSFGRVHGFSLRVYDAARRRWRLVLSWPLTGRPGFFELAGAFHHHRGEFFSTTRGPDGRDRLQRYTFSDITGSSLRWDSAVSADGGVSWRPTWIMEFTRRSSAAPPLPSRTATRLDGCPAPETRRLDGLTGVWEGSEGTRAGAASPRQVHTEIEPILDGCAIEERTRIAASDEPPRDSYAVFAWDARAAAWRAYSVDSGTGRLVAWKGEPGGDAIVFVADATSDGPAERSSFFRDGDSLHVHREVSPQREGPWRTVVDRVLARAPVGDPASR